MRRQYATSYRPPRQAYRPAPVAAKGSTMDMKGRAALPFGRVERYITDLERRHPQVRVRDDLVSMKCLWADKTPAQFNVPLYTSVPLTTEEDNTTTTQLDKPSDDCKHYVSVLLCLGADEAVKPAELHLSRRLKWLVYKEPKGTHLVGGEYTPADGKQANEAAFKKTAKRVAATYGIELKGCTKWLKFAEFSYDRPTGKCTSHVYIPSTWELSGITAKTVVEEVKMTVTEEVEKEVEENGEKKTVKEKVPVEKVLNKIKQRPIGLSLHDLCAADKGASCWSSEAPLCACSFDDMLTRNTGAEVLELVKEEVSRKRKRAAELEEEREAKKRKLEEEKLAKEAEDKAKEEAEKMKTVGEKEAEAAKKKEEEAAKKDTPAAMEEDKKEVKKDEAVENKPKMKTVFTYRPEILRPCQYQDKPMTCIPCGTIKRDAIETLLQRMETPLCQREVKSFTTMDAFHYVEMATVRTEKECTPEPEPETKAEEKTDGDMKEDKDEKKEETKETEAKK